MIELVIPNYRRLELHFLVLDFNGTIAFDGAILPEVPSLLEQLADKLKIFVLTADTFGTAEEQCQNLPVGVHLLTSTNHTTEKGEFVERLGGEHVVALGNGRNDIFLLKNAVLGIGILGEEGLASEIWRNAAI